MKHFDVDIQPRFSDFDMYGHLNNTHYSSYAEVAVYQAFVLGLGFDASRYGAITRQLSFEFDKPIKFGSPVRIQTRILQLTGSQAVAEHLFIAADNPQKVYAKAKRTILIISLADGRPASIPEAILQQCEALGAITDLSPMRAIA